MFIELHMLQNFAPSCLNRDDTNSPKDCEFGGIRRARISSQCLKRAIRTYFKNHLILPPENLAQRTKGLINLLADALKKNDKNPEQARLVAEAAARGCGLDLKGGKTEYLILLGNREIMALAQTCESHWDNLVELDFSQSEESSSETTSSGKKGKKKAAKGTVPEEVKREFDQVLDGGGAVDLALFGRMLADLPKKNIDAACQVAHALSTNRVSMEFDFYTAIDDLSPKEETGAGMMGTVEFNSACFYRYANIDLEQLADNLGGDYDLAKKAVEAFIRAAVAAIPTGKQNSMAAQNPPSLVFAVVRDRGLWSLANAFLNPVYPGPNGGLMQKSISALEDYWAKLTLAYGEEGILTRAVLAVDGELKNLQNYQVPSLAALVGNVMQAVAGEKP